MSTAIVLFLGAYTVSQSGSSSVADELPSLIRNGHRATRESIHSLHTTFEIDVVRMSPEARHSTSRVHWWEAGDRYRCSEENIGAPEPAPQNATSQKSPRIHQKTDTVIRE